MCTNRRWIKGWRWAILAAVLIIAIACSKEEPSQKPQAPRGGALPTIVATESPIPSPTAGHATGAQIATETRIEEKISSPTVQKEDAVSTGPRLVVSGHVSLQDGTSAVGAIVQLIKLETNFRTGATVEGPAAKASTDDHGHYRLVSSDYQYFYLMASHKAGAKVTTLLTDERLRRGEEQTGKREITHDFVLPPVAPIRGRVIDEDDRAITGTPIKAFSLDKEDRAQRMS